MSSSSSSSDYADALAVPHCDCQPPHPAKLRVSWRPENPARRFYNCRFSMYQNRSCCRFFEWVDPEVNSHYKKILRDLRSNANVEAVDVAAAERNLAIAEENLRNLNHELGQVTPAKAKEKEKAAVAIAVLKKDIEALQTRGKVYWYLILVLAVVVLFLVLLK